MSIFGMALFGTTLCGSRSHVTMLSAQMLGINGLITIANYCREWSDPRLIVVILNNRDLNMVTWELRALGGSPKIEETQNVPDFSYAQFAKTVELGRMRISKSEEVGPAWDAALGGPPIRHRCRRGCKCAQCLRMSRWSRPRITSRRFSKATERRQRPCDGHSSRL